MKTLLTLAIILLIGAFAYTQLISFQLEMMQTFQDYTYAIMNGEMTFQDLINQFQILEIFYDMPTEQKLVLFFGGAFLFYVWMLFIGIASAE